MRYIISGKNLDITEGLRSAVTDKLESWRGILLLIPKFM